MSYCTLETKSLQGQFVFEETGLNGGNYSQEVVFLTVARKKKKKTIHPNMQRKAEVRTRAVLSRVRPKEEAMNGRGGKGSGAGELGIGKGARC